MTKSAMEQMVEWLDKNHIWIGIRDVYKEARRLLAEEQAQKPTAPSGLDQIIDEAFVDCTNGNFSKADLLAISTSYMVLKKHIRERYRPAPSSDEGLRKALEMKKNELLSSPYAASRLIGKWFEDILSRHPSTAKSADRCGELVERLRAHIKYQKESEADYLVYGEIEDILSEFSKDADKEGR